MRVKHAARTKVYDLAFSPSDNYRVLLSLKFLSHNTSKK